MTLNQSSDLILTESFLAFKSAVLEEVKKEGIEERSYYFTNDFAFYIGTPVDYKQIKRSFIRKCREKFIETNFLKEEEKKRKRRT